MARQRGSDVAIRTSSGTLTFRDLDDGSSAVAHGLSAMGITRGTRTVLMVPPGPELFELTFALFKLGAPPVLVDPGMGVRNLGKCLAEANPSAFIGIPKAQIARHILGWARGKIRRSIWVGAGPPGRTLRSIRRQGSGRGAYPVADTTPEETAAILFTSGSTGPPKGAVYMHRTFCAQVEHLRAVFGIEPGEIDVPTFPLFALFAPALGMTAVIPDMDFTRPGQVDPEEIRRAVNENHATTMFGSPALVNRVGRYGSRAGWRFPSLRRVISAGAPVSPAVLRRFSEMLDDGTEVFTPYGATEALPVAVIGSREILDETARSTAEGKGVCVGRPVAGIDVRIIGIDDGPIDTWSPSLEVAPGQTGEIVVKGDIVTHEYFGRPEATRLAKIRDEDGSIRHRMGDVGYMDPAGRLWFCGRKAHRVESGERTWFTIPCEGVFNEHPAVFRTALVGVTVAGSLKPVLCVEREAEHEPVPEARLFDDLLEIAGRHEHTKDIGTFLVHPAFPVDIRHNAKIFREKLAIWAAEQMR